MGQFLICLKVFLYTYKYTTLKFYKAFIKGQSLSGNINWAIVMYLLQLLIFNAF